MYEFSITGDRNQAFLQLSSLEKDRDASRFVWYATRELNSKHLKNFPTAALMLDKIVHIDDLVASVETKPQIITLHR
ncbi:hypothetical protein TNIN_252481 [Trichonephila inaurata madagascariensis]|uniref:Uncharacterized protein n=1 Tax=Trichonephila inaurata madagascariensis TaxID=2747483 RepID=A0A8X6X3Z6_9ARAC|nr:hypothetical protein TNIN_252481 [Trichonephila inaurata madagascariensis]